MVVNVCTVEVSSVNLVVVLALVSPKVTIVFVVVRREEDDADVDVCALVVDTVGVVCVVVEAG